MKMLMPIFCNGILTDAGAVDGWTDVLCTHWMQEYGPAEKFENEVGAITRRWKQHSYATALADLIHKWHWRGYRVAFVGHSNAADIFCRAIGILDRAGQLEVGMIHRVVLIAPAVNADMEANGFADALWSREIDRMTVTVSPNDTALKIARVSRWMFGWLGLGYGSLGLTGPRHHERLDNLKVIDSTLGHSDWFRRRHLRDTITMIEGELLS